MSFQCAVCSKKIEDEAHIHAYIEHNEFKPERGIQSHPTVCQACTGPGTAYCPICRKGFKLSKKWQTEYYTGPYDNYLVMPCPKHSGAPTAPCDACGRAVEYRRQYYSPLNRLYCGSCVNGLVRCANRSCRVVIHPEDSEFSHTRGRLRFCKYCNLRVIPDWMQSAGIRHESQWDYRKGCSCKVCKFLSAEVPTAYLPSEAEIIADAECSGCNDLLPAIDLAERNNGGYCHLCTTIGFVKCVSCGEEHHKSNVRNVYRKMDHEKACHTCMKKTDWWLCDIQCKRWFPKSLECPCGGVFEYNYTPPSVRFLTAHCQKARIDMVPYMGLELEVEAVTPNASRREGAKLVSNSVSWAYPVHDGSLAGDRADGTGGSRGFEVVTYPFTLEWLEEQWSEFCGLLSGLSGAGFRSWESERCGMHIHISRGPMSEAHQMKMIRFILGNSNLCVAVGQRGYRSRGIKTYASFNAEDRSRLMHKIRSEENAGVPNHRVALNTMKKDTLEGRWFRGSLNPDTIRRNLEFMHSVWYFTQKFGMTSSNEFNYINWLRGSPECNQYALILDYLERNYVTRPWKGVRRSR